MSVANRRMQRVTSKSSRKSESETQPSKQKTESKSPSQRRERLTSHSNEVGDEVDGLSSIYPNSNVTCITVSTRQSSSSSSGSSINSCTCSSTPTGDTVTMNTRKVMNEQVDDGVTWTYANLSTTQERIKRFERETHAMLRRDRLKTENEKERVEREWQQAKRELESDDALDRLADDPSAGLQESSEPSLSVKGSSSEDLSLSLNNKASKKRLKTGNEVSVSKIEKKVNLDNEENCDKNLDYKRLTSLLEKNSDIKVCNTTVEDSKVSNEAMNKELSDAERKSLKIQSLNNEVLTLLQEKFAVKLSRSESLNKRSERIDNNNLKLRRCESLNKYDRYKNIENIISRFESLTKNFESKTINLKRSDSLTKTEKTESNLIKKRQQELSKNWWCPEKENITKLKRKNCVLSNRIIKRRHTVGGTQDFDKINWLQNKQKEARENNEELKKERQTSSPDLSSSRLTSVLVEVILRPRSLAESNLASRLFNLPLESHV